MSTVLPALCSSRCLAALLLGRVSMSLQAQEHRGEAVPKVKLVYWEQHSKINIVVLLLISRVWELHAVSVGVCVRKQKAGEHQKGFWGVSSRGRKRRCFPSPGLGMARVSEGVGV